MKESADTKTRELPIDAATDLPLAALKKLREPFADNHYAKKPVPTKRQTEEVKEGKVQATYCNVCYGYHHPKAQHLDYIGHAALTDRLLDVDPFWNWEPLAYTPQGLPQVDEDGGLWIRLTVCGVSRLGYGDAEGKKGPNATKERIGDALRNAAMRYGAALELWHKGILHMDTDEPEGEAPPPQQPPQKQARAERELCSDEKFATNEAAWKAVVTGGKKTPDGLIAFLGTKLDFTDEQKTTIKSWGAKA